MRLDSLYCHFTKPSKYSKNADAFEVHVSLRMFTKAKQLLQLRRTTDQPTTICYTLERLDLEDGNNAKRLAAD